MPDRPVQSDTAQHHEHPHPEPGTQNPEPGTRNPERPLTLAVILCTKDRPHDLARCLVSLAAQTRPADEIIIVDASGGAKDGGQRAEGRGQRAEDGGQRSEDGGQRSEDGGQRSEDGGQRAEGGGQRAGDEGRRTNTTAQPGHSPISNNHSPISNNQSPISNNQSPISNNQSPISNNQSPIPNNQSPIPNNQSPLTTLPSPPGLPAQRNLGLRQTQADVVAFFDDDVELEPGYLAALMAVYERRWGEGVGGVAGSTPGWRQSSEGAWWLKRVFGLTHVAASGEAVRLLPTLGLTWVAQPAHEIPCAALPGHCMSFRRTALDGIAFDESLGGYADGEDIDVGIQVGRRYPLWQTPDARLTHHKSRLQRADLRRRFFTRTRNERYLHRKLMPQTAFYRLAWVWGAAGRLLVAAMVGLRQGTPAPLLGVWAGLRTSK